MPRAPRIEFAGAVYHVMNRGDRFEPIFRDDQDREMFLKVLEEASCASGWRIHSFVLMPNHYHLLVETVRPTLVKGMQYLNGTYTQRFNGRYKQRGHLFQGRYKALLVDIEEGSYFLTVSDYIHLNPVRAKLSRRVEDLLRDRWSSVGWLTGVRKKRPAWLEWRWVYGELGLKRWDRKSRKEYRRYIERRYLEEMDGKVLEKIREGWCMGGEGFMERMKDLLEEVRKKRLRGPESWAGPLVEECEEERAEKLMKEACTRLGYGDLVEVKGLDKYLIGKYVRAHSKVKVQWLADRLNVQTRGGMSHMIYWIGKQIELDVSLKRRWKRLL